ncbi:recombinase family protein [Salmonella enterica]|nr:recombinase family protein [Salmonella enterica]
MTAHRVYSYMRASTSEQDATRARKALQEFAKQHGLTIAAEFWENVSGTSRERPELMRLLEIAQAGDILLVEQVDRLSRLSAEDWQKLKAAIDGKGVRIVALDLPTSYSNISTGDDFTQRMVTAVNGMMLEMLAAIAEKDNKDRKRRQAQGIAAAKAEGKFTGRRPDEKLHARIIELLQDGNKSMRAIARIVGTSTPTVSKVAKQNGLHPSQQEK